MRRRVGDIAAVAVLAGGATVAIWAVPTPEREPEWTVQPPGVRPIAALTPGVRNPDVRQSNILVTICKPGWTATIRPPSRYTQQIERELLPQYYGAGVDHRAYVVDHLIPLSLGGHPTDRRNLWPQPDNVNDADGDEAGAKAKDRLEARLKRDVCEGYMRLDEAQRLHAEDWYSAYQRFVVDSPLRAGEMPSPEPD